MLAASVALTIIGFVNPAAFDEPPAVHEQLYEREQVRQALRDRPGQGARTDLQEE